MGALPIETVLMDVGGTLLPNTLTLTPRLRDGRTRALSSLLGSGAAKAASVIEEIETQLQMSHEGPPDRVIARVLVEQGFEDEPVRAGKVRQALCVGLAGALVPFDHADELLAGINALGLRCVVLSNTELRDAEMYRRDFTAFGWARWAHAYVT